MSNIIINANESQKENQKTTPVKESFSEPNNSNTNLLDSLFLTWLGRSVKLRTPQPLFL